MISVYLRERRIFVNLASHLGLKTELVYNCAAGVEHPLNTIVQLSGLAPSIAV
jgi:hypothetical protein